MEKYLNIKNGYKNEEVKIIANLIKQGKVLIFPTETVYGIGTNGLDKDAVKKVFEIKKRSFKNPINLLVNGIPMVEKLAKNITPLEYKLMETFFPGPFTIILNKKEIVPDIVTASLDCVGVRMSSNQFVNDLITLSDCPIAAPSANISGHLSKTNLDNVFDEFSNSVDYIVDGGKCEFGIESTVVRVTDGIPNILRPGFITKEQIEKVAGKVILNASFSPSNKLKHYQLDKKTILVFGKNKEKVIEKINEIYSKKANSVIVSFDEDLKHFEGKNVISLGSYNNLVDISKIVFSKLESLEKENYDLIILEGLEEKGLGITLMDRFKKICNNNSIKV